ncbi:hypothetical protein [Helicobacter trogontum]|uniref:hypothetical protein n=1 Tax=Helicobacter trogontum TaxID=50960 RepID=UPI0034E8FE61
MLWVQPTQTHYFKLLHNNTKKCIDMLLQGVKVLVVCLKICATRYYTCRSNHPTYSSMHNKNI